MFAQNLRSSMQFLFLNDQSKKNIQIRKKISHFKLCEISIFNLNLVFGLAFLQTTFSQ